MAQKTGNTPFLIGVKFACNIHICIFLLHFPPKKSKSLHSIVRTAQSPEAVSSLNNSWQKIYVFDEAMVELRGGGALKMTKYGLEGGNRFL